MLRINVMVDYKMRREIEETYGDSSYSTVEAVINETIRRHLNSKYFDPNLDIRDDNYSICEYCGEKAKRYRMFDCGNDLEEHHVCANCGSGQPYIE